MELRDYIAKTAREMIGESNVTDQTRNALLSCLEIMEDTIDVLCPTVVVAEGGKIATLQGPDMSDNWLVIFATPQTSMVLEFNVWPDIDMSAAPNVKFSSIWAEIVEAVERHDADAAVKLLTLRLRMTDQLELTKKSAEEITKAHRTPVIISLSAIIDDKACGATFMLPLPETLQTQHARATNRMQ